MYAVLDDFMILFYFKANTPHHAETHETRVQTVLIKPLSIVADA